VENADGVAVSTLRDYIEVLKRRRWVVLLPLVVVPLFAILLSLRQPAIYQASAQVLISRENLATQLEGLSDPNTTDPARTAGTQAQLARVPEVARRALAAAHIHGSPSDLLGASSVTATPETDLLVFRVRDGDPDVATALTNAYAREFTIYRSKLELGVLEDARARIHGEIRDLKGRGDRGSAAFSALQEKDHQLLTMEALQTGRAQVVREAAGAGQIQPEPKRDAAIGFVLAIVLGLTLALLWEALDSRVRSAQDVAARLRLPLLGRIPWPPRRIRRSRQLVMLSAPFSRDAEAFRMLRTNVEFAALDRGDRVLMVTSAQAGEGKSTTIANLAIAFAHAGRRTILADLDFRNLFLEGLFGLEGRPGVTDVAAGAVSLEQALIRAPLPRGNVFPPVVGDAPDDQLWILPSGTVKNHADFGAARGHREMLRALAERADVVLIDAPPLPVVGDAMALTAHVDGIMVVTRSNLVPAATLDELRRVLDMAPAKKVGFVLTGSRDVKGYYEAASGLAASDVPPPPDLATDIERWKTEGAAMATRNRL